MILPSGDVQSEQELRLRLPRRPRLDFQSLQLEGRPWHVVQVDHDVEERVPVQVARRLQFLHQLLEGQILVA